MLKKYNILMSLFLIIICVFCSSCFDENSINKIKSADIEGKITKYSFYLCEIKSITMLDNSNNNEPLERNIYHEEEYVIVKDLSESSMTTSNIPVGSGVVWKYQTQYSEKYHTAVIFQVHIGKQVKNYDINFKNEGNMITIEYYTYDSYPFCKLSDIESQKVTVPYQNVTINYN